MNLLLWEANSNGSWLARRLELNCNIRCVLKHFMMVDVTATGWQSIRQDTLLFLDTGIIVVFLGTSEWSSQRLKISVNTSASWSAQVPRIWSFNSSFRFSLRPWMKIMSRAVSQQPLSKAEPTNLSDGPKKERTQMQIHWEILKKTQNPDVDGTDTYRPGTDIMQNWLVGTQLVMISGSYTKW